MKEKKELANTGCNWAIEFSIYKTRALFAMLSGNLAIQRHLWINKTTSLIREVQGRLKQLEKR
jgi:hypothetical protein